MSTFGIAFRLDCKQVIASIVVAAIIHLRDWLVELADSYCLSAILGALGATVPGEAIWIEHLLIKTIQPLTSSGF
jgi:hypothetical protein